MTGDDGQYIAVRAVDKLDKASRGFVSPARPDLRYIPTHLLRQKEITTYECLNKHIANITE
jgi:hypothetical protein